MKRQRPSENANEPAADGRSKRAHNGITERASSGDTVAALRDIRNRSTLDTFSSMASGVMLDSITRDLFASSDVLRAGKEVARRVTESIEAVPNASKTVNGGDARILSSMKKVAHGELLARMQKTPECVWTLGDERPEDIAIHIRPPQAIEVVGAVAVGVAVNPLAIDISVQVPSDLLQSKDYLNYRYHNRRLLYLVCLARILQRSLGDDFGDFKIGAECLAEDPAKPLLTFSSTSSKCTVRILPTIQDGTFEMAKLSPDRGNVRPVGESSVVAAATPLYNRSVVMDARLVQQTKTLRTQARSCPAFTSTFALLRAWAGRRRLGGGSGFPIAALLAHTVASGAAPARAGRDQLLRAALVAVRNGALDGLSVCGVRVSAQWDNGRLQRWQCEATHALGVIDSPGALDDTWSGISSRLFLSTTGGVVRPVPLCTLYDGFVQFSVKAHGDGSLKLPAREKIATVLDMALVKTGRVERFEEIRPGLYGMTLASTATLTDAFRKVDTRPDDVSKAEFAAFWGTRSSVRRFADGRIVEAVVWQGGIDVLNSILQAASERNLPTHVASRVVLGQLTAPVANRLSDPAEASRAISVFNRLSTMLRKVEGLPLRISTVLPTAALLRRCSVQGSSVDQCGSFVEPLEALAVFEESAAWPDDVLALASAKAAFYVAMQSGLAALGVSATCTVSFIDVDYDGFIFRLRVRVDKEKELPFADKESHRQLVWETETRPRLHDGVRNITSKSYSDTVRLAKLWLASQLLLSEFGDRAEELVEIVVAKIFEPGVRDSPRSVLSGFAQFLHLLSEYPWHLVPLVVHLQAEQSEMGAVEAENDDIAERRRACAELYDTARTAKRPDNARALHIISTLDPLGHAFSRQMSQPGYAVLKRAKAAAAAALQLMDSLVVGETPEDIPASWDMGWASLYQPSVNVFDGMLVVDPMWCTRPESVSPAGSRRGSGRSKALSSSSREQQGVGALLGGRKVAGLDPVERLVAELRRHLGHVALFCYDKYGGKRIMFVWKPDAKRNRSFSLQALPFSTPLPKSEELKPERSQMEWLMRTLGGAMLAEVVQDLK